MLLKIAMCFLFLFGGFMTEKSDFNSLNDAFKSATSIVVYDDNTSTTLSKGDDKYEEILLSLESIIKGAHEMPAFSVSLDEETRKELKKGFWIELVFDTEKFYGGMNFDKLLISIKPENSGFNIIRHNNGKYDGRCFYLDLDGTMKPVFDKVIEISKN